MGNLQRIHEQAFQELLIVDSIRGPHSTGIAAISSYNNLDLIKKPVLPQDLLSMKGAKDIFFQFNKVLIGHNRWATQGAVNGVNAHPFDMGNILGAHNGTLINQTLLPDSHKFEVDSENIFHAIQEEGIKETWGKLHGAASLVWYDFDNKTVNFLRNEQRPMYITFTEDDKTMFWASEDWMLEGILAKNDLNHGEIFSTTVDTHYEVEIPENNKKFSLPLARLIKPYKPPVKKPQTKSFGTTTTTKVTNIKASRQIGEEIYFYLDPYSVADTNYIEAMDADNISLSIRIFCKNDSWLRKNMEENDNSLYVATVNGSITDQYGEVAICQENSVSRIGSTIGNEGSEEDEEVEGLSQREATAMKQALARSAGACAICNDTLALDAAHVVVNEYTIVCKGCKGTDYGQEVIKYY